MVSGYWSMEAVTNRKREEFQTTVFGTSSVSCDGQFDKGHREQAPESRDLERPLSWTRELRVWFPRKRALYGCQRRHSHQIWWPRAWMVHICIHFQKQVAEPKNSPKSLSWVGVLLVAAASCEFLQLRVYWDCGSCVLFIEWRIDSSGWKLCAICLWGWWWVIQIRSEICAPKNPPAPNLAFEHICGRPLGLRFNKKTGDLWIADAYLGILKVGPEGGQAESVVAEIDGVPMKFCNDLDFDEDGVLYFTDSSTKWHRR